MSLKDSRRFRQVKVSMKSGLEGRNNRGRRAEHAMGFQGVSMKSGLEGRNNRAFITRLAICPNTESQ